MHGFKWRGVLQKDDERCLLLVEELKMETTQIVQIRLPEKLRGCILHWHSFFKSHQQTWYEICFSYLDPKRTSQQLPTSFFIWWKIFPWLDQVIKNLPAFHPAEELLSVDLRWILKAKNRVEWGRKRRQLWIPRVCLRLRDPKPVPIHWWFRDDPFG